MSANATVQTAPMMKTPASGAVSKPFKSGRLAREWKTVMAMLEIYCCDHHGDSFCRECEELQEYVKFRLNRCRFGEEKPTCAKCPVHCYQKTRREQIKEVMRYAGPRMIWKHPWLSTLHTLDGLLRARVTI